MESKNPMVRLVTYGNIKKMMTEFEDKKLDNMEKNMLRGMYQRKLKDFAEHQHDNA